MTAFQIFDVLIVGAGLSGIGAAHYLQEHCPEKSYAILESRGTLGGTWDLFRYPGIRSDSDMYTLGYKFKPWKNPNAIAGGAAILNYIQETADESGITKHIRFGHTVLSASWSSVDCCWTLRLEIVSREAEEKKSVLMRTRFLYMCSGYYDYSQGHRPEFVGETDFAGQIIHPQFWPENLDVAGKRIVVIGSGATAVTLVPSLSKEAAHVTMLQRSPTYVVQRPARDKRALWLQKYLPAKIAYRLTRWKFILESMFLFQIARRRPEQTKRRIIAMAAEKLGPDVDASKHFSPKYKPWDQRVCIVPDGDLFDEIRSGRASIETDIIDRFASNGIKLQSGRELEADIIVVATGLKLKLMGGASLEVDGKPLALSESMVYKGMMLSDVPNFVMAFGYTNASWTLKTDLTAGYVCRLLKYMDKHQFSKAMPQRDKTIETLPFLNFTSGYVERAAELLPKQGIRRPWQVYQNYLQDLFNIRHGQVADGVMRFDKAGSVDCEAARIKRNWE
ncbi:MAG: NAD(P)/FAD-dependent oxidoreductase [Candidatus Obscuribacterales bacterium]|nr:NAD(P)/FAD-dependent oxidoreductase [Candidatus Obscuribacterales bacterium]